MLPVKPGILLREMRLDKTTIKTFNFTNVRIQPGAKQRSWSPSNIDVSYSYIKFEQTNPLILKNDVIKHRGRFRLYLQYAAKIP